MKRILLVLLIFTAASAGVYAGDIGKIFGVNIAIGAFGGAAMGTALSVPPFLEGDGQNVRIFAAGAGWGAVIGASVGLVYSFYNVVVHVNRKEGSAVKKSYFEEEDFGLRLTYGDNIGIKLTKNF